MANVLKIPVESLQAANLAIRSDFKNFVGGTKGTKTPSGKLTAKGIVLNGKMAGTASAVAIAAKDAQLRDIIQKYTAATSDTRKKFVRAALTLLN